MGADAPGGGGEMSKIYLNLGCGEDIREAPGPGWLAINHDRARFGPGVDQTHDLNRLPWPWHHDSIHVLIANSVLEHLTLTLVESMNECWRILMPGGQLDVKLPLWDRAKAHLDPTHRWFVAKGWFDNFDPDRERYRRYGKLYGIMPWRIDYEGAPTDAWCLRGILIKRPVEA